MSSRREHVGRPTLQAVCKMCLSTHLPCTCLQEGRAAPGAEGRLALLSQGRLPGEYSSGLAATEWPGRSQVCLGLCDIWLSA